MDSSNLTSMLFLLIGKESHWLPFLAVGFLLLQNWDYICEKLRDVTFIGYSIIKFRGITYYNTSSAGTVGDISLSIRSLLHAIQPLMSPNKVSKQYTEFRIPYEDLTTVFIPCNSHNLQLTPTIQATFNIEYSFVNSQTRESLYSAAIEMARTKLQITLASSKNMEDLNTYIRDVAKEYDDYIRNQSKQQTYIVKPALEKDKYCEIYKPIRIPLKINKSFDTLFFPQKEMLLRRLDMLKNPIHYTKLGLPQSLGILLYGEPGTGKTSAIKAIANYMKKNIVLVPMSKIKTRQELENIFYYRECTQVNSEDSIYVFEEIDCNGWGSILMDRKLNTGLSDYGSEQLDKDESIDKLAEVLIANSGKSTEDFQEKRKKDQDKLTLGCLLEIMDGIIEIPGRIIIMTTNYRKCLDSALTRPGRIDIEIEFKALRNIDIAKIYKQWYDASLSDSEIAHIKSDAFTQAQLSQLMFQYEKEPEQFLAAVSQSL